MNRFEFYKNLDEFKGTRSETFLQHYGILGQKWGQRRWQNPDGTFNTEGKIRYFGSKKAAQNLTNEEIASLYSTGQKIKNLFPQKRIGENGEEYDARYQNHYGYLTEKGKRYLEKHPHDATGKLNMKLYAESLQRGAENDAEREKERLAREAKQKSDNEYINNLKSNIKTTKELKSEEISDKEFKDIIQELDNFDMRDFEKNNKEDYNKVADIGIDALNKAEGGWVEDDIRDDGNREWFMWEDQTIGNPEIAYLYYKGYSKDYIKQYLNKYVPYEDREKYSDDEYSKGFFVQDEFHRGGDAYIDALFDKGEEDQKIGGLFSKDENKKAEKKAAKEAKKINNELEETFKYDQGHEDEVMDSYILESEFAPLFTELRQSNNQKLDKEYKRTEEIFEDFEKNQVNNFATAGITNFLDSDSNDKSMSDLVGYVRGYIFGDANQGYANAESLYTKYDKNIDPKEIDDLYQKLHVKNDLYNENIQYLKDNNKTLSKVKDEYLRRLVEENDEGWMNFATKSDLAINSYWDLYNAADDSKGYDNNLKNKYKEAKSISSKLNKSCGNDELGWNLLNLALLNLGLDKTNYKDITSSDWNKINKEISELKEEYKETYED